jgi:hypothetical protein
LRRRWLLWTITVLVTVGGVFYQRLTGPTHPVRVNDEMAGRQIKGKLIRSQTVDVAVPIRLTAGEGLTGDVRWRRWPGEHPWHVEALARDGRYLVGSLPPQSATAARIEYEVRITDGRGAALTLPARLRFKGDVPAAVLIFHVLAMLMGMLLSLRTGLEALSRGPNLMRYAVLTVVSLGLGGLLLGPVVQKYAFDAYWTGWPVGEDLTDNKTALAVLAWLVAVWQIRRGRRWWAVGASAVTLAVYLIPHSMHGSTHDWQTGRHIQALMVPLWASIRKVRPGPTSR